MPDENLIVMQNSIAVLKLLCLWPKTGNNPTKRYYLVYCAITVSYIYQIYSTAAHLILYINDPRVDVSSDLSAIGSLATLPYINAFFVRRLKDLAKLYTDLSNLETFGKPDNFEVENRRINFWSKVFSRYIALSVILYNLSCLADIPKCKRNNQKLGLHEVCGLVMPIWSPYNINSFPAFQLHYIYVTYVAIFMVFGAAVVMFMVYETSEHIRVRFRHLNGMLRTVFDVSDPEMQKRRLHHCIKYHNFILDICKNFTYCYQYSMGIHILMGSVVIGSIGYMLTTNASMTAPIINFGGWLICLFVMCIGGQNLVHESVSVGPAAFMSKWYTAKMDLQKDLMFLIYRSQQPVKLRLFPLGELSIPVFINILKTGYSYMTLLSQTL